MKKTSENRGRLAGLLIVLLFVATALAGAVNAGVQQVHSPSAAPAATTISGDITVGTGYSLTTWTLSGGSQILEGNLTVASGGVVILSNESLVFDEFSAVNSLAGYESAPIYHITVQDGGKLVMYHSTITTNIYRLNAIPVLGIIVQDNGTFNVFDGSSLVFPGQLVVSSASMNIMDSSVSGFPASSFSSNYINETVFPVGIFDNPPVVSMFGANVLVERSSIAIYQNNTTGTQANPANVFHETYPFAADSGSKNNVVYRLEGTPTTVNTAAPLSDSTKFQNIANLSAYDGENYVIQANQVMAVTGFNTAGVSSPLISASLHISYLTQGTAGAVLHWTYGNDSVPAVNITLPASSSNANVSGALPAGLTVNDLSRGLAWLNATATTGTILVNKLWVEFTFTSAAYKNMTVGGSSSFTAIDSFIGANFNPSPAHHTAVVMTDTGHAYFYNVHIDLSSAAKSTGMYSSALFGEFSTMTAKPLEFGPKNTATAQSLSPVDSNGATYYAIPASGVFQTYGMNVTTDANMNTRLASAIFSISSDTTSGAVVYVGEIGQSGLINTGISLSNGIGSIYTVNLYNLGFNSLADISKLVVYIPNGASITDVKNVNVQVQLLPQLYLYRFANVTVYSSQHLPVSGSSVALYYTGSTPNNLTTGSLAGYFVGPGNTYQTVPPASVLSYLGKSPSNYNVTNQFGNALIPLLSDVIDASTYPDSMFTGNYSAVVSYNGSSFGNSISFTPYPIITGKSLVLSVNITIGITLPLPLIQVGRPYVVPSFPYVNQSGTVIFNVTDSGQTGISSLPINVTDGANGKFVSDYQTNISVGPRSTVTVSISWHFTAPGNNSISVFANQFRTIPESSYAGDTNSTIFYVEPNLPELVILSSGITFNPSPAYSGKSVAITAAVQNFLGRAGAVNVTVGFYYGNPLTGGSLIGKSRVNVSAAGSNTTTISWTPNTIGQVPIYVYIDPFHLVQQYSTAGNINSSVLTVYLSIGGQDLVVNNSNSNPISPFTIPAQLNLSSNVIVTQSGYLAVVNGGLNFIETYGGQYSFLVNQTGKLLIENSNITSTQLLNLYVYGSSRLIIVNSVIGANVNIILGGGSVAWINSSKIEGTVSTAAFSSSSLNTYNSSYSNQLTVGYNEIARLYNVAVPYVAQQSNAVIYIYRWLSVTVYGPSGTTISGANVTLYTFSNLTNPHGSKYAMVVTNSSGVALFAGLSDTMISGSDVYTGNYVANTSYYDAGTWYAPQLTVSLAHYTAPLLQTNSYINAELNIKLPDLVLTSGDIVFSTNPVVEASHITVDALVYNLGYGSVHNNFTVTFYLPGSSPVNVTTSLLAPLTVNSAVPVAATWNVPMSYGNMTVSAAVNLNRNVTEISYGNNYASTSVDVLSLPDLSPVRMNATGNFQEFSNITFNVVVGNSGQTPASNVPVQILDGNSSQNTTHPIANGTMPYIGANANAAISIIWTVPQLPAGVTSEHLYFAAVVNPNQTVKESNYTQSTIAQAIQLNITRAQVTASVYLSQTSLTAGTYISVTVSVVSKVTGKPMAGYPLTVTLYNLRGIPQTNVNYQVTTGANGVATERISIPSSESQGSYHFVVFSEGQFVSSSQSFNVLSNGTGTGIPLLYWLLILVVAVGAFAGFSAYLYRYGLARVVECGNCGAFIPETSKKCPYCSVEFEPGTAKCSNCSSWIPASSKECPICGVKFADEGESDREEDTTAELRKQYSVFADKFKAQAKVELGNKYTDKAFLSWWKRQSTYTTFEDWLSKQQEARKARMITCPVCGEPNTAASKECMKCGSQLSQAEAQKKDDQPPGPPTQPEGKAPPQEPRKIVVPKRVIRKIEDRPQQQPPADNSGNKTGEDGNNAQ